MNSVEERHEAIIRLLSQAGSVSVEQLAHTFMVSEVSIRKDLAQLENQGKLVRRLGGAVLAGATLGAANTTDPEKCAIARCAAARVKSGNRIVIDSGQTTLAMLAYLGHLSGLVIMTNSLATAVRVTEMPNSPTLLMAGGTWDRRSQSFQGQLAEKLLAQYDFDLMFVGADGVDVTRGTTTFNELTDLSRTMAKTAAQVVLLAESKKVGRRLPNLELGWPDIDVFISDAGLEHDITERIQQHNVDVICADQ